MATASSILSIARSQLGNTSGAKYWDFVVHTQFINGAATPWCACFVSWVFNQAGQSFPGLPGAYTPTIYYRAKSAGLEVPKQNAHPGDVVLFDWNMNGGDICNHIGIVEANCGDYLQTIEGNTNGSTVARRTRSFGTIRGIFRPQYDGVVVPANGGIQTVDVDGWGGPKTISLLQVRLGTPVDGVLSGQYRGNKKFLGRIWSCTWESNGQSSAVKELQRRLGIKVDGFFGHDTAYAYQAHLGVATDGLFGPNSTRAMQAKLNTGNW